MSYQHAHNLSTLVVTQIVKMLSAAERECLADELNAHLGAFSANTYGETILSMLHYFDMLYQYLLYERHYRVHTSFINTPPHTWKLDVAILMCTGAIKALQRYV